MKLVYKKASVILHGLSIRDGRELVKETRITRRLTQGSIRQNFERLYLLTHPRAQCGESDPVVLEFHHVGGKDMAISEMITRVSSVDRLKEELEKTMVLCANCHRRITAQERGWFRSKHMRSIK